MECLVNVIRQAYVGPMTSALADAINEGREELTPEESRRFAEEQVQRYLGLSVDEFLVRAEEGTLPEEDPMVVHLALLTGAKLHSC